MFGYTAFAELPFADDGGRAAIAYTLPCDGVTYTLSAETLTFNWPTPCAGATLAFSGGAMVPDLVGAVTAAGRTFIYSAGTCVLPLSFAMSGSTFALFGGDMTPVASPALPCASGTFSYSGGALTFAQAYRPRLDIGDFTLAGGGLNIRYWEPVEPTAADWSDVSPISVIWTDVQPNN